MTCQGKTGVLSVVVLFAAFLLLSSHACAPALAQKPDPAPKAEPPPKPEPPKPEPPKPQPPPKKPAPEPAPYELRIIRVGKTFQGVRFHKASGESWLAKGEGWEKIPETGVVPPGDYDVVMVGTDEDFMAFRLERRTGATWLLRGRRWLQMKDPE